MSNGNVKEYPPCPYKISQARLDTLWLVIPVCIGISFIRDAGIFIAIAVLAIWVVGMMNATWNDWTKLCDSGMVFMEVDNNYLLKYGFVQERPGLPVRKLKQSEIASIKEHLSDPNWFRYDYPWHERDDYHYYYDKDVAFWLTKEEYEDKRRYDEQRRSAIDDVVMSAIRIQKRLNVEYGEIEILGMLNIIRSSEYYRGLFVKEINKEKFDMQFGDAKVYFNKIRDNVNPFPDKWSEETFQYIKKQCWKIINLERKRDELYHVKKWKYPEF